MIRKLRWKFSAIMMTIVTVLLIVIFVTMYYSSKMSFVQRSLDILHAAMMEGPHPAGMPPRPRREELLLMVTDVNPDGSVTVIKNQLLNVENSEIPSLISFADSRNIPSGTIKDKHLRYLRQNKGRGDVIRYAFADIFEEQNSLYWQSIHSAIIGLCSLAAFFLFSILLSRWATKPVEEAWKRQKQFVADASHELKTPLTVILSNADMLIHSSDGPDDKNRQRMEHIQAEAIRMKQLVESLLTLARSDSGQSAAHKPLDLSYIVNSSIMTFEPLVFDMEKTISSEIEEKLQMIGDEKKLRQLIDILLDNACKYSKNNGAIFVSLSKSGPKEALLVVANEGTPLAKENINQIFCRFYRADSARSSVPGYGLGLSIARSIAEEHSGKIEAVSDGVNTNSFLVHLPLPGAAL